MTSVLQFRRGNTAQNNSFTGAVAEISIDTSTNTLRVHNGITAGGTFIMPTLRLTNAERLTTTAQIGQFIYVTDHVSAGVAPTWVGDGSTAGGLVAAGGVVSAASTASNIAGGLADQIPYQSASGQTTFNAALRFNGTTFTTTNIVVSGTTNSLSNTSTQGALLVTGGAAIARDLFVGGDINLQGNLYLKGAGLDQITGSTGTFDFLLVEGTGTSLSVFDGVTIGGDTLITKTTSASSTNTGALQVRGGLGVAGGGVFGGIVTATTFVGNLTGTASTATSAGTSANLNGGAAGSVPYQSAAGATTFLNIGTNGFVLTSNGSAPTWSALSGLSAGNATTATNLAGGTAGQVPYQTAGGVTSFYGPGTAGQLLVSAGTGAPTYTNTSSIYVNSSVFAEDLYGGAGGQLAYQSAANVTAFISTATTGNFLQSNFNGAPTWTTTANIYVANAAISTNLRSGVAGQLAYQTAANATGFITTATTGNFLQSNFNGAPTWTTTANIYVNRATLADTATTATSAATAYSTIGTHTAGTGLSGTTFNGSTAVTWTLNTATYMASAVTANNLAAGTAGSVPYQSAAGATTFLSIGTNGFVLTSNGSAPTWSALSGLSAGNATTATNIAGGTAGQVPYQTAAGVTSFYGPGTGGQLLVSAGTGAPTYTNTSSIYVQDANVSTNIRGGTPFQIPYQSAANTTAFANSGTTGQFWQATTNGAPTWTTTANIYVADAAVSTNLRSGAAGSLPYQTAANATGFVSIAAAGSMLVSTGSTPSWIATSSIYVNRATLADTVLTAQQSASANYYPTFVDANNASASTELVWTTSTFYINPASGATNLQSLSINSLSADTGTKTSNSLYVAGGAWIDKTLLVAGDTTFRGSVVFQGTNTFVYSSSTVYTDNLISLHAPSGSSPGNHNWTIDDGKDIGLMFHYYKTTDKDAFLGFANDSGYLEWYDNGTESGGVFTGTSYGTFKTGAIKLVGGAANTGNTSTGDLTVLGGVGVGGSVYVAGNITVAGTINASITGVTTTATNIAGGSAGQVPYQTGPGVTSFVTTATTGNFLQANFTGAPTWTTTANIYVANANVSTNLRSGVAGQLAYQTAANATGFITTATTGNFLQSNFNGAPTWTTTANIYVNRATLADSATTATSAGTAYATIAAHTAGTGLSGTTFNGSTAVTWTLNTATYMAAAVTANNLAGGSAGQFAFQTGAGATSFASTGSMYVGRAVIADSASGGSAQVNTVAQPLSANYFPTFVDSNNASAAAELVYTTSSFVVNPGTGFVGIGGIISTASMLTVNGRIESITDSASEGGQLVLRGKNFYRWSFDNYLDRFRIIREDDVSSANGIEVLTITSATAAVLVGTNSQTTGEKFGVSGGVYVSGAVTATSFVGNLTGNVTGTASNATTATSAGTAYATIAAHTAGAGLSGTTFNGSTAVTWTLNTATYMASAVTANNLAAGAAGSLPYQSAGGTTTFLGIGTNGFVLTSNGSVPTWTALSGLSAGNATTATNLAGGTAGQVPYQTAAGSTSFYGPGTAGQLLVSAGAAAPVYTNTASIYVQNSVVSTNLRGGSAGNLVYQLAAGSTAYLGSGVQGQILTSMGPASAPAYANTSSIYVNSAVFAEDLYGGAAGSLPYQTAANVTAFVGIGTNGQVLTSNGTAPVWSNASGITAGSATTATSAGTAYATIGTHTAGTGLSGTTFNGSANVTWTLNTATLVQTSINSSYVTTFDDRTKAPSDDNAGSMRFGFTSWTNNSVSPWADYLHLRSYTDGTGGGDNLVMFRKDAIGMRIWQQTWGSATAYSSYKDVALESNNVTFNSMGVGTAASGTAGEIRATNEITAYYSDRRLKENVQVIDNAVTKVLSLNGITYTPNDLAESFGYDKNVKLVGLFADEVEAVLPEATRPAPFDQDENGNSKSGENYKTIQYEKLVPLLIEAIKEQERTIQSLKSELDDIKKQLGK